MEPKFKVGEKVVINAKVYEISILDRFGVIPHYGIWRYSMGGAGWIPCSVLDEIGVRLGDLNE